MPTLSFYQVTITFVFLNLFPQIGAKYNYLHRRSVENRTIMTFWWKRFIALHCLAGNIAYSDVLASPPYYHCPVAQLQPWAGRRKQNCKQLTNQDFGIFFCQFSVLFVQSAVIILNTNWTPLLNLAEGNVSAYIYLHLIPQILIQTSSEECIPLWTPSLIRNGTLIKLCLVFAIIRIPMCINAMCRLVTI